MRTLCLVAGLLAGPAAPGADDFKPLFNGKDLTGWDGNPDLWSVADGCIVGKTTGPDQLKYNQFLIWRGGPVKNFELTAKIQQTGNNSGIQYRSKELPDVGQWSVGGYQLDIHPTPANNAMMYHERGRSIVAQNGQSVVVDPAGKRWLTDAREAVAVDIAEWHEYGVTAVGNKLTHKIDGKVVMELTDYQEKDRSLEGLIAFQIHRGPAMTVRIKDVRLKTLPDAPVPAFDPSAVPAGAKPIDQAAPKKPKAKAAPQPKQPKVDGAERGDNKATPIDRVRVLPGFRVELVYSVPQTDQGSWVNLCEDDRGRIYTSDQYGGLYRLTPPPAGQPLDPKAVEKLNLDIRAVNGMVFAFGALYVGVNDYEAKIPSGLYRITDSDKDGELDKVELLRALEAKGDHGVHAVVPTPDGQALYLVCGNGTKPVADTVRSRVPANFGEDHLLPRMPDGRGFMRTVMAPGGIIYRVSPDGKEFTPYASGFRNVFDAAVNRQGELFTYDADMEYDFNTSWYRPTRINHVVSGAEYGWRNGAGKRPEWYADNLPATVNIGPGSPTGTTFGYGAKFPAKYQNALYALDWSWGKLYAIHLEPSGATYTGTKEEFLSGLPLPLTDAIVSRRDGAMYFTIGGRKVQSGLYRVTYVGPESTAPVMATPPLTEKAKLRRQLEAFHGVRDARAVAAAWPYLGDPDRYLRWAARTVVEHQPVAEWAEKALTEPDPTKLTEALLALARCAGVCPIHRTPSSPPVDAAMREKLLAALLKSDLAALPREQQLTVLRTIQIVLNRFGNPDPATAKRLTAALDAIFPAKTPEQNWLLCETLAYLQSPTLAAKGMALIAATPTQEEQMEYARSLRMLAAGWTPETRTAQLNWFQKAANYSGGASFDKFVEFIRTDSLKTFTPAETQQLAALIAKVPERKSPVANAGEIFQGRPVTNWTLDELSAAAKTGLKGRDFDNGRKMFAAGACFTCHRFDNQGGMTGPDLTAAGRRYSPHDLLDQILNPSKEINEQFVPLEVKLEDGEKITGVLVNLKGDTITLNTDLSDPNQRKAIDRRDVVAIGPSKVSPMPTGLLGPMTKAEVLDLLAYTLSGGDRKSPLFAP